MADLFISYARSDRDRIEQLAQALAAHDYSIWWDRRLVGGDEFSADIERELSVAGAVLVAWSSASTGSRWVKDEASVAADAGKLIALSLDGSEPPIGFRQFHCIDLSRWNGQTDRAAIEEVLAAIRARLGDPDDAPPAAATSAVGANRTSASGKKLTWSSAIGLAVGILIWKALPDGLPWQRDAEPSSASPAATTPEPAPDSSTAPTPKLAILSFTNIGEAADNVFSEGISAELNSRLSGLRFLSVIGPNSVRQLEAQGVPSDELAKTVGADYLLSGSVRWSNESGDARQVRVNAELTQASDNRLLWSGQLDQPMSDLLKMQSDIAAKVIEGLNVSLSQAEREQVRRWESHNALAFEAYLQGRHRIGTGHGSEDRFREAHQLLEQATRLDPNFPEAWLELAGADMGLYWNGFDFTPERLDTALSRIEKAQTLSPNLPATMLLEADYHYRLRDFDRAQDILAGLLDSRPNDPEVLQRMGFIWRRQGLTKSALQMLQKTLTLDPLNARMTLETGWTQVLLDDYDEGIRLLGRTRELAPGSETAPLFSLFAIWCRGEEGDLEGGRAMLESFPNPRSGFTVYPWFYQHLYEGDPQAALDRVLNSPRTVFPLQAHYVLTDYLAGMVLRRLQRPEEARTRLESALTHLVSKLEESPEDFRIHLALGKTYAELEEAQLAFEHAQQGAALMPSEKDPLLAMEVGYQLMEIMAVLGRVDEALDQMAFLLQTPSSYDGIRFTHHPDFAAFRDTPRFRQILGRDG
ncbi:MAG: TIR domain-containing protein [Pseudomonadota bacterium]